MKIVLAIVCSLFAAATAFCPFQLTLSSGSCNPSGTFLCRDPCPQEDGSIPPVIATENCTSYDYCCVNAAGVCVLKDPPSIEVATVDMDSNSENYADTLRRANAVDRIRNTNTVNTTADPNDPDARGFPGVNQGYGSYCPTFPYNCPVPQQHGYGPQFYQPPVDIPYCQRIACEPSNPFLDNDFEACTRQPGCYFDQELFAYRNLVGQAILPGVPVCHLAIRNQAFLRRARSVVQSVGSWNTVLTDCVLREFADEIFGNAPGCQLLDYLVYFGHTPKRAGWRGIQRRECELIGACWRQSDSGNFCAYPTNARGQPTLRSSNDDQNQGGRTGHSSSLYGLPVCFPLDASLPAGQFLSSYHTCLSSGCASSVDRETLWEHLIGLGSSIPYPLNIQYINMVYSGQARPDNYQSVIESILSRPPTYFGPPTPPPPFFPNIPYSFNVNSRNGNTTSTGNQDDGRFFLTNGGFGGGNQQPPFGGGNQQYGPGPGAGGSFPQGGFPGIFPPQPPVNPCPYHIQSSSHYGLPRLTGSVVGCCDQPLCYLPKRDLYEPYSGISSYLSHWSRWSVCSAECGGGLQNRTRRCNGKECSQSALLLQTRSCNDHQCPMWGRWGRFSECSATCGGGFRMRSRSCEGVGQCVGDKDEVRPCRTGACPTYRYDPWGPCSNTCGRGTRRRAQVCVSEGFYGCQASRYDEGPCEQFCGRSDLTCNELTCCWEKSCVQADGSPGHCAPNPQHDFQHGKACGHGNCFYTPPHQRCPSSSGNQYPGSFPNSFNFNG